MKITVPPDIERAITTRADELGTTPEVLALDSLRERFSPDADDESSEESKGKTLADFLEGYVGVLHSAEKVPGGARMSENRGKKFAEGLAKKREAGHL
ncbi:MAG: hypothetical protein A3J75_01915 [Acidobacteria bacterium RBG_16_68_9]|nr:MAG: hypothetical protein A3J75_01915 [Acidobacteria bacterium RBG_16_68_9]